MISTEFLLLIFLFPYLFYLSEPQQIILPRETAEITQDIAQMFLYGFNCSDLSFLSGKYAVWYNGEQCFSCNYVFRYCTTRLIDGREVRICAAACSP